MSAIGITASAPRDVRAEISEPYRPSLRHPEKLCSVQSLAKLLVETAFADIVKLEQNGELSEAAKQALVWLVYPTNWIGTGHIPPEKQVRDEYFLSFSWCCEVLGYDAEQVLLDGLPAPRSHGPLACQHVAGLNEVFRVWQGLQPPPQRLPHGTGAPRLQRKQYQHGPEWFERRKRRSDAGRLRWANCSPADRERWARNIATGRRRRVAASTAVVDTQT